MWCQASDMSYGVWPSAVWSCQSKHLASRLAAPAQSAGWTECPLSANLDRACQNGDLYWSIFSWITPAGVHTSLELDEFAHRARWAHWPSDGVFSARPSRGTHCQIG